MHSGHALGKDRNLRVSSSDAIDNLLSIQKVVSFVVIEVWGGYQTIY